MALLDIIKFPARILKAKTQKVSDFDGPLHLLLDNMRDTMYAAEGIGLAAPQINVARQITVVDVGRDESELREFINPTITAREGKVESEEGCLSIPDFRATIMRSEKVQVNAYDRYGKEFVLDADGLLAICLQHEIDHLDGVLFIDRMSQLKREMFMKKFRKFGATVE